MSSHADPKPPMIVSKRRALGQFIVCRGCCCGRTDRGFPEVPVERIKAAWKAGRLNRTIQLTISGCVGPCDVANVAVIVTPEGTVWIGGLNRGEDFDAVVRWAESSHAAGEVLPIPIELACQRFDYLVPTPHTGAGRTVPRSPSGRSGIARNRRERTVMDNPFGARTKADPGRVSEIKRWASRAFGLGEEVSVMVTELRCTEPGCLPLETVIALLGVSGPTRQYKLHKAVAEVTEADVKALASGGAPACGEGPRPGGGCEPS